MVWEHHEPRCSKNLIWTTNTKYSIQNHCIITTVRSGVFNVWAPRPRKSRDNCSVGYYLNTNTLRGSTFACLRERPNKQAHWDESSEKSINASKANEKTNSQAVVLGSKWWDNTTYSFDWIQMCLCFVSFFFLLKQPPRHLCGHWNHDGSPKWMIMFTPHSS